MFDLFAETCAIFLDLHSIIAKNKRDNSQQITEYKIIIHNEKGTRFMVYRCVEDELSTVWIKGQFKRRSYCCLGTNSNDIINAPYILVWVKNRSCINTFILFDSLSLLFYVLWAFNGSKVLRGENQQDLTWSAHTDKVVKGDASWRRSLAWARSSSLTFTNAEHSDWLHHSVVAVQTGTARLYLVWSVLLNSSLAGSSQPFKTPTTHDALWKQAGS